MTKNQSAICEWLIIAAVLALFLFLGVSKSCAQLPDAPSAVKSQESQLQVLTWKQTVSGRHAKLFWAAHALFLASIVADVELTHQGLAHHKCIENSIDFTHPSRGHMYAKDLSFFAGFTVADLLLRKAGVPFAPYVAPMIGAGKHAYGAYGWPSGCW